MRVWRVEFAAVAEQDFGLIFDHPVDAYVGFGDPADVAFDRASARIAAIQDDAENLGMQPYQGTLRDDLLVGVRFVRINKALFWFHPDAGTQVVRILAVFFGAQDHINHMMLRLLARGGLR